MGPLPVDDAWIRDAAREQLGPALAARVDLTGHVLDVRYLDDERDHEPRSARAAGLIARLGPEQEAVIIAGQTVPLPADDGPVGRLALAIAACDPLWGYKLPEPDRATLAVAATLRALPLDALLRTPYAGLTLAERARVGLVTSFRKTRALLGEVAALGRLVQGSHPVDLIRLGAILRLSEALAAQGIALVEVRRAPDDAIVLHASPPAVHADAMDLLAKAFKSPVRLASQGPHPDPSDACEDLA